MMEKAVKIIAEEPNARKFGRTKSSTLYNLERVKPLAESVLSRRLQIRLL